MLKKLVLEFPEELSDEDLHDKEVIIKGREGVIMTLLHKGKISQGKAAEMLNIDRYKLFDLMAKYNIATADFSANELERQRQDAHK